MNTKKHLRGLVRILEYRDDSYLEFENNGRISRIAASPAEVEMFGASSLSGKQNSLFLVTTTAEEIVEEQILFQDSTGRLQIRVPVRPGGINYIRAVTVDDDGGQIYEECWFEEDWCEKGSGCMEMILRTIEKVIGE
jgi:hypothetical protein